MKAYTDLEQSKKLADILPYNTADNTWEKVAIAGSNLNVPEEKQYVHNGNMPFCFYSGIGVPCWSLAALLNYIKDKCSYFELAYISNTLEGKIYKVETAYRLSSELHDVYEKEPVDACVKMIIELHELNIL